MSCGVGRRHSLDPALLGLWYRPAAVAPIQPLVWELPYAVGVALKSKKTKNKQTNKKPIKNKITWKLSSYHSALHIEETQQLLSL